MWDGLILDKYIGWERWQREGKGGGGDLRLITVEKNNNTSDSESLENLRFHCILLELNFSLSQDFSVVKHWKVTLLL